MNLAGRTFLYILMAASFGQEVKAQQREVFAGPRGALLCTDTEPLTVYVDLAGDDVAKAKFLRAVQGRCSVVPRDTAMVFLSESNGAIRLRKKGEIDIAYSIATEWRHESSAQSAKREADAANTNRYTSAANGYVRCLWEGLNTVRDRLRKEGRASVADSWNRGDFRVYDARLRLATNGEIREVILTAKRPKAYQGGRVEDLLNPKVVRDPDLEPVLTAFITSCGPIKFPEEEHARWSEIILDINQNWALRFP